MLPREAAATPWEPSPAEAASSVAAAPRCTRETALGGYPCQDWHPTAWVAWARDRRRCAQPRERQGIASSPRVETGPGPPAEIEVEIQEPVTPGPCPRKPAGFR